MPGNPKFSMIMLSSNRRDMPLACVTDLVSEHYRSPASHAKGMSLQYGGNHGECEACVEKNFCGGNVMWSLLAKKTYICGTADAQWAFRNCYKTLTHPCRNVTRPRA